MLFLEIDIDAVRSNINTVRQFKSDCGVYAVVKANAYGHGIDLCKHIQDEVYGFAVSCLLEAEQLIRLNIAKPILILSPQDGRLGDYKNIIYTACNIADLKDKENCSVAIKVNSGMNRLGASKKEFKSLIEYIKNRDDLYLREIFTHIYSNEGVKKQFKKFISIVEGQNCRLHCLSSNYLFSDKKYYLDSVRCGLSLYGYTNNLSPSLRAYARIIKIRNIKKGEHIGYGDFTAHKKTKIAIVSCGYADGIKNYTKARVNGVICDIIGRICMDMCFIDITDINANKNDKAYFIDEILTVQDIAKKQNSTIYEVLTSFSSNRIERIYYEGNKRKI